MGDFFLVGFLKAGLFQSLNGLFFLMGGFF